MDIILEKIPSLPPLYQRPRHVHAVTDRFSLLNTYVIDDGRLIVVDPGSILNTRLMLEYLQRFLHRSPRDIDLIVLTHLHPDHTAGVAELRRVCHAPVAASVIAQYLVRKWHGEDLQVEGALALTLNSILARTLNTRSKPGIVHHLDLFSPQYKRQMQLVDLWLDDVVGLPNHPDWRVIASPGHTPESLCLYNPFSYELLCGDTLIAVEGGAMLVRRDTSYHQLEATLHTLRTLQVHYLYPGHGRPILSLQALANARIGL
ncbi:MAG: MBL fold metallo-hydrolase [Ktedonobacteraceae bacterium]